MAGPERPQARRRLRGSLLLVHDSDDADVAISDARAIVAAWPRATLVETSGLGHNGILRDSAVIECVAAFLAEGPESKAT